LALGLFSFFTYTGVETAAGQWSFTVLTERRGVPAAVAGILVSLYWAGLTAGRVAGGAAARAVRPGLLIQGGSFLAVLAAVLFWWHPIPWIGLAALPLLGLGLAPIFPGLMTLTPERVGPAQAASAIGYQAAVAGLGATVIPASVGLLLQHFGLEMLGPFLVATAILLVAIEFVGSRRVARPLAMQ
ncbi:MAG: MFS transporter, partial [Candidatus Dormibacteraeota bacterium]|nr:MFS transporter [Candidatus Dormibacteraeota bacterium]